MKMRTAVIMMMAALAIGGSAASAQTTRAQTPPAPQVPAAPQTPPGTPAHPDFSGHWVLVPDKPGETPSDSAAAFSADFTIEVKTNTMVIDSQINGATARRLFNLAGVTSMVSGSISTSASTAKWEGDTLLLITRSTLNDSTSRSGTVETTRALSLAADGTLVIDVTTVSIAGTQKAKSVYKKAEVGDQAMRVTL
jgi:hypothetical protein